MVQAYWQIGKRIVQDEQRGEKRAAYGEYLLKELSKSLQRILAKAFHFQILKTSGNSILLIRTNRFATYCVAN